MGYERITEESEFDGLARNTHEYRYLRVAEYTKDSDVVLDAACGVGYGEKILKGKYIGVDKFPGHIEADLNTWVPDFEYDVFVSLETIEHLDNYTQHVKNAKKAKRIIAISAPIVPTVIRDKEGKVVDGTYHVQDFTMDELKNLFKDDNWSIVYEEIQINTCGLVILKRNG